MKTMPYNSEFTFRDPYQTFRGTMSFTEWLRSIVVKRSNDAMRREKGREGEGEKGEGERGRRGEEEKGRIDCKN